VVFFSLLKQSRKGRFGYKEKREKVACNLSQRKYSVLVYNLTGMVLKMAGTDAVQLAEAAISDEEIVGRVRAGETALFAVIMRRYNRRLYRVARAILGDDSEAEDVMQDAFVRSYMHLAQFDGRAKFSTWLTKIAVYEAGRRARDRRRFVEVDAMKEPGSDARLLDSQKPLQDQELLTRALGVALEAAIERLPDTYSSVFMLREVEGLSTAETAECLGLTDETVKVRLHRARGLLRKDILLHTGAATATAFQFAGMRCDRVVEAVLEQIALIGPLSTLLQ
jgi:RNA polymerase sigma-70 factor (ECF subfamily)